jgi:RimJ/RimL family protein N-acetyltransferase
VADATLSPRAWWDREAVTPKPNPQDRSRPARRFRERGDCAGEGGEYGQLVELQDGTRALIRPIAGSDRERLREGFEGASADSNFLRFLVPKPRLSSNELDYLTAVDHSRHEALIAVDPKSGESFGTARYVRSEEDPETAEFAIGLGDRWMGIGLGTALFRALIRCARGAGVVRFTGLILAENTAVKRLIEKVAGSYEQRFVGQGAVEVVVELRSLPPVGQSTGSICSERHRYGDSNPGFRTENPAS